MELLIKNNLIELLKKQVIIDTINIIRWYLYLIKTIIDKKKYVWNIEYF